MKANGGFLEETRCEIVSFYSGKDIFITGGTGFLGKFLIEKLLRCVPDIGTIFVLVRPKKGTPGDERLKNIIGSSLFERLGRERPSFGRQVVAVPGDCSLPGLGLAPEDREAIVHRVHLIFHCAALLRMDAPLKEAAESNVLGTRSVLELAEEVRNLQAVVFVSTVYTFAFADKHTVEENVNDVPFGGDFLLSLVKNLSDDQLSKVTHVLKCRWPNTYCFTKSIAEDLVREKACHLPASIFRPAIVCGARAEPEAGWVDNLYGGTGCTVFTMLGLLRTQHGKNQCTANLVPVNMCVNAIVAAAWETATAHAELTTNVGRPLLVYNFVPSSKNAMNWKGFTDRIVKYGRQMPPKEAKWLSTFLVLESKAVYLFHSLLLEFAPAALADLFAFPKKLQFRVLKTQKKVFYFSTSTSYFALHDWKFDHDRVQSLWKRLSPADQSLFPFNMDDIDWDSYMADVVRGCLVNIFKEKNTPQSELDRRHKLLLKRHLALKRITVIIMALVFIFIFSSVLK